MPPLPSGLGAERDREMGLPSTDWASEDHVAVLGDPAAPSEVRDHGGVDAVGSCEIEGVDGLELGEACLTDPLSHGGIVTGGLLDGEALVQVVLGGPPLLAGLPGERLEAAG